MVSAVDNSGQNRQGPNLKDGVALNAIVERAASTILPRLYDVVGVRGSSGLLRHPAIEPVQLQQMVDRSAIIGADQANNAKKRAVVAELG